MEEELSRKRAKELISKAEGETGTFVLWRSKDNYSNAAGYYKDAGVQLKIAKDWRDAANLYLKAADLYQTKCEDKMNTAICYQEAGLVLKQIDMSESVDTYRKAANIYQIMGRGSMAAKIWAEMAELYDNDLFDRDNAIKCHISAGDCYRAIKSEASAQSCFMKAAELMSLEGRFFDAIKQYEQIAEYYSRQTAMPHHVNNCCYRAVLCMFVQEVKNEQKGKVVKTRERLLSYTSSYPTFDDHDDAKLCNELITHYENNDVEAFQTSLSKRKYKLQQWSIDMLITIKRALDGANQSTSPSPHADNNTNNNPIVHKKEQYDQAPIDSNTTASENVAADML